MKLSFSISSKSSSASRPPRPNPSASSPTASPSRPQYVTTFDPTETLTNPSSRPVIPPLENSIQQRASKRMKNLVPPSDDNPSTTGPNRFVLDSLASDSPQSGPSYGLTVRPKSDAAAIHDDPVPFDDAQRFKADVARLPDDRGIEEFRDVSVEDFSRAILEGYGWTEGRGIGRNCKEDVKVVEQRRWAGKSGLGFDPEVPRSENKGERRRRSEEELPAPPARSDDGRKGVVVVRVVAGVYIGMKGEILKSGKEDLQLSLLESGEKVTVGSDMVAELGSAEEERCLRKLKQADAAREVRRGRDEKAEKERVRGAERNSGSGRQSGAVQWLRSHIRVRVISKKVKGGRLYLKKGIITDVIDPVTCDISMDEGRELLQGVNQEMLETALPQRGGPVIVLFGRHKGVYGKLVEKDREKEIAIVRDDDNHEIIKVRMEQIAEYVGDPSDLGY